MDVIQHILRHKTNDQAESLQLLIAAKADATICMLYNSIGWTPLFVACGAGNTDCVRVLLQDIPSTVNTVTTGKHRFWSTDIRAGTSPIEIVKKRGHTEIVTMLRHAGAQE